MAMIEQTIIVPGDPKAVFTCITDDSRPDPSHCWGRAMNHIFHFKDVSYFTQLEAAATCRHMVEAILKIPRPPRRAPVKWGWGKGWPGQ
jgi:hypothetical protein